MSNDTSIIPETVVEAMSRRDLATAGLTGYESLVERVAFVLVHLVRAYGGVSQVSNRAIGEALLGHRRNRHLVGTDSEIVDAAISYLEDRYEEATDEDVTTWRREILAGLHADERQMIVINVQFLTMLGMPADEADVLVRQPGRDGLAISSIFSFGGGGDRRSLEQAQAEQPTALTLVGMADRYNAAARLGLTPREICVDGHGVRRPTPEESLEIGAMLGGCPHPAAARIAELVMAAAAEPRS